jgi:hypothetical protein
VWSKILLMAAIFAPTLFSSASAQPAQAASFAAGGTTFGRVETLQGKIIDLDLKKKVIFVKSPDNVTYKFVVASNVKQLKTGEFESLAGKTVEITFIPTRTANIAQKIELR